MLFFAWMVVKLPENSVVIIISPVNTRHNRNSADQTQQVLPVNERIKRDIMSNTLVDVYPYTGDRENVRFLILRRSNHVVYANQWRMTGGKVAHGEHRVDAALRECYEETGCVAQDFWVVPAVNQFYDPKSDTIHHVAAFAARLSSSDTIRLNHEHTSYKWISKQDVKKYINWPQQVRLIYIIHDILTGQGPLSEWYIPAEK